MESNDTPARPALTFEEMPQAVSTILDRLEGITTLINDKFDSLNPKKENKEWMDINELCEYLPEKPAKATVYGWVCAKAIPYTKSSKKLSFSKEAIDRWQQQRQRRSAEDIRDIADDYVNSKKM